MGRPARPSGAARFPHRSHRAGGRPPVHSAGRPPNRRPSTRSTGSCSSPTPGPSPGPSAGPPVGVAASAKRHSHRPAPSSPATGPRGPAAVCLGPRPAGADRDPELPALPAADHDRRAAGHPGGRPADDAAPPHRCRPAAEEPGDRPVRVPPGRRDPPRLRRIRPRLILTGHQGPPTCRSTGPAICQTSRSALASCAASRSSSRPIASRISSCSGPSAHAGSRQLSYG